MSPFFLVQLVVDIQPNCDKIVKIDQWRFI